jgi:hypothetical protein
VVRRDRFFCVNFCEMHHTLKTTAGFCTVSAPTSVFPGVGMPLSPPTRGDSLGGRAHGHYGIVTPVNPARLMAS